MVETAVRDYSIDPEIGTLESRFCDLEEMVDAHAMPSWTSFSQGMSIRKEWAKTHDSEAEAKEIAERLSILDLAIGSPSYSLRTINILRKYAHGGSLQAYYQVPQLMEKHLPQIQEAMASATDFDAKYACFDALVIVAGFQLNSEAWDSLKENSKVVIEGIKEDNIDRWSWMLVKAILFEKYHYGNEFTDSLLDKIKDAHRDGEISDDQLIIILSKIADSRGPNDNQFKLATKNIQGFLAPYGIKPDDVLVSKWISQHSRGAEETIPFNVHVEDNMKAILYLEKERPGIAKTLFKKFGIRHFDRYPLSMLIEQFDQMETDAPWILLLTAEEDYNLSFIENDIQVWDELRQQVDGKYLVRFVEGMNTLELARIGKFLKRKYADSHKAAFTYFTSHGNHARFALDGKSINRNQVEKRNLDVFSDILEEGSEIVWSACWTGSRRRKIPGIASTVSKKLGHLVISPASMAGSTVIELDTSIHPPKADVVFEGTRRYVRRFDPSTRAAS